MPVEDAAQARAGAVSTPGSTTAKAA